MGKVI
jgi:hypothetical protein